MSSQPANSPEGRDPQDDQLIEGGNVFNVNPEAIETKPTHRERTARTFTLALLGIFAGSLLLHYAALLTALSWGDKMAAEMVERQFNAWLPVISGMVGSAATYYLTKEKS
jgi:hypothetical protein